MSASSRTRPSWRRRWRTFRRELPYRFYAGRVARELNFYTEMNDRGLDALEDRVTALEEIIAAGDAEAAVLRERLRGELREVNALYAEAETTFRRRRQAWAGDQNIIASLEGAKRRRAQDGR